MEESSSESEDSENYDIAIAKEYSSNIEHLKKRQA
jgi:hypothetical protein